MRILFATDARQKISTQLNAPNYAKLNELDGVSIDFYNHNYADYDVVLFMGYDPRVAEAREAKPTLKIGVIDLRPSTLPAALGADFVIANGLEMQDWLSNYFENIFIYPIYPLINAPLKIHEQKSPLIIGYHGNKVHLATAITYITTALEELARHRAIELWAVYDIQKNGELPYNLCNPAKVPVRLIQWTPDVYEKTVPQMDIGIVPNLIPFYDELTAKKQVASFSSLFQPHDSDYLLRFKNTTNAGRIYVFSQLGIPVVAGMTPSAAQAIQHGKSGYLVYSTGGWYNALTNLADSAERRTQMGRRLYDDFCTDVSTDKLNRKLVEFIQNLKPQVNIPARHFIHAGQRLDTIMPKGASQPSANSPVLSVQLSLLWNLVKSKMLRAKK